MPVSNCPKSKSTHRKHTPAVAAPACTAGKKTVSLAKRRRLVLVKKHRPLIEDSFRNVFGPRRERTRIPSRHEEALALELLFNSSYLTAMVKNDKRLVGRTAKLLREVNVAFDGGNQRAKTI